MKEEISFNCKKKDYTTYDYSKKMKIAASLKNISENSNSQGKEQLFLKLKKEAYLFLDYLYQNTYFVRAFSLFNIY